MSLKIKKKNASETNVKQLKCIYQSSPWKVIKLPHSFIVTYESGKKREGKVAK